MAKRLLSLSSSITSSPSLLPRSLLPNPLPTSSSFSSFMMPKSASSISASASLMTAMSTRTRMMTTMAGSVGGSSPSVGAQAERSTMILITDASFSQLTEKLRGGFLMLSAELNEQFELEDEKKISFWAAGYVRMHTNGLSVKDVERVKEYIVLWKFLIYAVKRFPLERVLIVNDYRYLVMDIAQAYAKNDLIKIVTACIGIILDGIEGRILRIPGKNNKLPDKLSKIDSCYELVIFHSLSELDEEGYVAYYDESLKYIKKVLKPKTEKEEKEEPEKDEISIKYALTISPPSVNHIPIQQLVQQFWEKREAAKAEHEAAEEEGTSRKLPTGGALSGNENAE